MYTPHERGMRSKKQTFDTAFKRESLQLIKTGGKPLAQVAHDLGISDNILQGWKQQHLKHGEEAFPGSGHLQFEEAMILSTY